MSEQPDKSGSGSSQWGSDWFFRKQGNKTTINTSVLKWAGGVGVLTFAAVQFTDTAPQSFVRAEVSIPSAGTLQNTHDFPVAPERSFEVVEKKTRVSGKSQKLGGPQIIARPRNLAAIPPGALVKATLLNGASNGAVKARLDEALLVNGDAIIEGGSTLFGQGTSTEERLMVVFNQVVFRDGSFGNIQAHACDQSDQIVGLKGSRIGTRALNVAGGIGLGFVGGMSEGLQESRGEQGVVVKPPTVRNALLHATATTALDQSRSLMSGLKERKPIIEVPNGTAICVLFGGTQ